MVGFFHFRWTEKLVLVEHLLTGTRTWVFFCQSNVFGQPSKQHVATGAVRSQSCKSLGYCYLIGRGSKLCVLGDVTGLLFFLHVKPFRPSFFKFFDFWRGMSRIILVDGLADTNVKKELGFF